MPPGDLENLADRLLEKIRKRPGHYYDSGRLIRFFKTDPERLTAAVDLLRQWGYRIRYDRNRRPAFMAAPDKLLEVEIRHGLKTKSLGRKIHAWKSVQSTNLIASQLAAAGAPEGTLVVAEHQSRGRGRLGRSWDSPEALGIYMSLVLYPDLHPSLAPGLSLVTAVALADTISRSGRAPIGIKWPNDVLIDGKKTAGILTELSAEGDRINHVIVGIGINVNQRRKDFSDQLQDQATSIRLTFGRKVKRVELLRNFLKRFEEDYFRFKRSGLKKIRPRILEYSILIGREISLKPGRKTVRGRVVDIDEAGHLVLETAGGPVTYSAGEVTLHNNL